MSIRLFNLDFFKNLHLFLKPKNLIPNSELETINNLYDLVKSKKFTGVILDVDQTIVPYGETKVNNDVKNVINNITKIANCCILSNFPKTKEKFERLSEIQKQLNIPLTYSDEKKPSPKAFISALKIINTLPSNTAMVGDRIFTDIIGANDLGIYTIYIKPLKPKTDPFLWVTVPRMIELAIYKFAKLFF